MKRSQDFFKRFDRYSANVSLNYKHSGKYETTCGGICSIISFLMLSYYLILQFYGFFHDKDFNTSQSESLT